MIQAPTPLFLTICVHSPTASKETETQLQSTIYLVHVSRNHFKPTTEFVHKTEITRIGIYSNDDSNKWNSLSNSKLVLQVHSVNQTPRMHISHWTQQMHSYTKQ